MMEELEHHGYHIGPGTLYPLLHGMEKRRWLKSSVDNTSGRNRRVYKITPSGRRALEQAMVKVDELHDEMHEEHPRKVSKPDHS
jgi:DNA-binding PadR family transcriptional regulator